MASKTWGLRCPIVPAHGTLYALAEATPRGEGWYCPHQEHDGWKDQPYSRPFFTTAVAEAANALLAAPRRA
jgi:hypothetical protein